MVHDIAVRIFTDVGVHQPALATYNFHIGVPKLTLPPTQGLHFRARENYSSLKTVIQEIIVPRLPIIA